MWRSLYLKCESSSQAASLDERSGRKEAVKMMMKVNLSRRYRSALKLTVAVACLAMLAASPASAETFKVSTAKQLEEAVTKANANGVANTI
jgi:hypothetical protein